MSNPADDIMRATYDALCRHGYADLTMRHRRGGRLQQGVATLPLREQAGAHARVPGLPLRAVHRPGRRRRRRAGRRSVDAVDDPDARLREFIDDVFHPPAEGDTAREIRTALLEIKAQSPYDDAFRERIAAFDDHIYGTVHDLVVAGIDGGVYREATDPDEVARFVLALVDGAQARHVVAGEDVDALQSAFESYLDGHRQGRRRCHSERARPAPPAPGGRGRSVQARTSRPDQRVHRRAAVLPSRYRSSSPTSCRWRTTSPTRSGWVATVREALAAISFGFPMVFFLISLGMGVSVAGSVLVAQHTGADETRKAQYAASQTVTFAFIVSLCLGTAGFFFVEEFLAPARGRAGRPSGATAYLR